MRSKTYSIGVLAVLAFGLSACTDDRPDPINTSWDVPISTPTPTQTPTVATTGPNVLPGAKPPVLSDAAFEHTQEGAVAFLGYVVRALDWGYSTTDSSLLAAVYAPECESCARQAKIFDDVRSAGWAFRGGHVVTLTTKTTSLDPAIPAAEYAFDSTMNVEKLSVVDRHGNTVRGPEAAYTPTFRFYLGWIDRSWKVVESKEVVKG